MGDSRQRVLLEAYGVWGAGGGGAQVQQGEKACLLVLCIYFVWFGGAHRIKALYKERKKGTQLGGGLLATARRNSVLK